jgi:hypothetical protein
MSLSEKGDNSAAASPDRHILPVKTGKGFLSGAAKFAGHSIEEYAFKNTQNKNTQLGDFCKKWNPEMQNPNPPGTLRPATHLTKCQVYCAK